MNEQTTSSNGALDSETLSSEELSSEASNLEVSNTEALGLETLDAETLDIEAKIRQMRWRCRRGILEVEMILQPYFERHAQTLVTERKVIMDQLLACADTDLMAWFTGGQLPAEPVLSEFVQEILAEQKVLSEQASDTKEQGGD